MEDIIRSRVSEILSISSTEISFIDNIISRSCIDMFQTHTDMKLNYCILRLHNSYMDLELFQQNFNVEIYVLSVAVLTRDAYCLELYKEEILRYAPLILDLICKCKYFTLQSHIYKMWTLDSLLEYINIQDFPILKELLSIDYWESNISSRAFQRKLDDVAAGKLPWRWLRYFLRARNRGISSRIAGVIRDVRNPEEYSDNLELGAER